MPLYVCLKHRWAVIFLLIMALSPKCRLAIWQRLQIQKKRSKFCNSDPLKIVLVIEREYLKINTADERNLDIALASVPSCV